MAQHEQEKAYQPAQAEEKWYAVWESRGYFTADNQSTAPRFSIVIPPPNLTGSLHMGHALQHTLHDILVRWKRMCGFNTLWLPGTDHASIAVHYVLEKQLEAEKKTRFDLGRERFLELAWKWKETSGGTILTQMRRLGVSCDWTRERFTMDPGLSRAVQEVFIRLYREGLIYRGEYIVNWCPRCKTAISDLEVVHETRRGSLWYIQYPLVGGGGSLTVATTRPETMLGDTAVAVHPDDERYRGLVGRKVLLPVAQREIPIVADTFVDREFGTGVVKLTPAHDPNDYEAGKRHDLPRVTVIGDDGSMTAAAGAYAGLDRFVARKRIVEQLQSEGLLVRTEDHQYSVGQCDRCGSIVEPKVSMQWFLRIEPLAGPAIQAVESGAIEFVPDSFRKRYFDWMYNIHDWCISRQLWWGHRIPAWYCDACGEVIVAETEPERCACGGSLRPETDILDTWFSSALWPFSTLGWPDRTRDLEVFYPTDVLITGPDIIFFWVARMIMTGLRFMGDVPFRRVHINGIVRDASGKKMSKTRGNVIEPLQLLDEYGADAVRFTLSSMAVPGTDIPFSTNRMKGYSAFANKVWNAARFLILNLREGESAVDPAEPDAGLHGARSTMPLEDRWILARLDELAAEVSVALERFRFHEASSLVYQFFWHELCDWYIELVKPVLTDAALDQEARAPRIKVLIHVLDYALRILHPFMPFLTEELWQKLPHTGDSIMVQEFPQAREVRRDAGAVAEMQALMDLTTAIRSARAEMTIPPRKTLDAFLKIGDTAARGLISANLGKLGNLARLGSVEFVEEFPAGRFLLKGVAGMGEFGLDLAGAVDPAAERERLGKERKKLQDELERITRKMASHDFLSRAPEAVVEENRTRQSELVQKLSKVESIIGQLPR
jgi:valyl-tRNA synthetase